MMRGIRLMEHEQTMENNYSTIHQVDDPRRRIVRNLEDYPSVMTVGQLIEVLPLGRNLIYKKLNLGDIPSRRVGQRYVIYRDRIREWLATSDNEVPR